MQLEVKTLEPVFARTPDSIYCRIDKDIADEKTSFVVQMKGSERSSDDSIIVCALPTYLLSHLLPYKLSLSSNGGIDYSASSFKLRAIPVIAILNNEKELVVQGRRQRVTVYVHNIEHLSGQLQCLYKDSKSG